MYSNEQKNDMVAVPHNVSGQASYKLIYKEVAKQLGYKSSGKMCDVRFAPDSSDESYPLWEDETSTLEL